MATHQQTQSPSDFPSPADDKTQISEATKPANEVQQAPIAQETVKQEPPTSVFKNSEPIREDQIQNAIKFLSHPWVKGSPVIHRRSICERKGLTKEEIDEVFRRVPDPPPSSQTTVVTSQDGQQAVSTVQPQAMQPVVAAHDFQIPETTKPANEVQQATISQETVKQDPPTSVFKNSALLLFELKEVWEEIGEPFSDRDKALMALDRECNKLYECKLKEVKQGRDEIIREIEYLESRTDAIKASLGEGETSRQSISGNLKLKLQTVKHSWQEMETKLAERRTSLSNLRLDIIKITNELEGLLQDDASKDLSDYSLNMFAQLRYKLQELQNEKINRVKTIQEHLKTLQYHCSVLGMDFNEVVHQVHPTLSGPEGERSLSLDTIKKLRDAVQKLSELKMQRKQKVLKFATTMSEHWNRLETTLEEKQEYQQIFSKLSAPDHEITEADSLSEAIINRVKAELLRLDEVKAMNELVLEKRSELAELYRETHMVLESDTATLGLEHLDQRISKIKGDALIREKMLQQFKNWSAVCLQETWLETHNEDPNRYKASFDIRQEASIAHANVMNLPSMTEALVLAMKKWEKENRISFLYDGEPLSQIVGSYMSRKQEKKEQLRRRVRSKVTGQPIPEQKRLTRTESSPLSDNKGPRSKPDPADSLPSDATN